MATLKNTNYVVASDITEAWLRFRAKLYIGKDDREYAEGMVEEFEAEDRCDPPCKYGVYRFDIEVTAPDPGPGPTVL